MPQSVDVDKIIEFSVIYLHQHIDEKSPEKRVLLHC